MARKKQRFQWTVEDGELPPISERRDRNEARVEREALVDLACRLEAMPSGARRRLPLGEPLLEAIEHLARLGPQSAHRRQMLRVQKLLRAADVEAIEAHLAGFDPRAPAIRSAERWRDRLLEQGDEAMGAYLEEHPGADRQQLRALIRQASKPGAGGKKARRKLYREILAATVVEED